ncbi:MAG: hypothetical protein KGZ39_00315 [Simkania sp.]|nr:hypothetical protein [Simkania sp.]
MNLLGDVITYVRRIVKTPSNTSLSDNLIIDYINRFWLMDVDARVQLFDLKTEYGFQTSPGIDQYNMPLYGINSYPAQVEGSDPTTAISYYPVYQGFLAPAYANGRKVPFYTQRGPFFSNFSKYMQPLNQSGLGDGTATYTLNLPSFPALRGHVDNTGIIAANAPSGTADPLYVSTLNTSVPKTSVFPAVFITTVDSTGRTIVVNDSGQFLTTDVNLGLLTGNTTNSWGATTNVVNYDTGVIYVTFSTTIPDQTPINVQCYFYQQGIPRGILFYNNIITIRPPPDISYYIEMDAYLTPAAFLTSSTAIPFAYMSEYIARGAARKILSDTGDVEQFNFYEPLFREQEMLVWKRSQRQFTSTKAETIYSQPMGQSTFYGASGSV